MITCEWKHLPKKKRVTRVCDLCGKTETISVETLKKYGQEALCRKHHNIKLKTGHTVSLDTREKISKAKTGIAQSEKERKAKSIRSKGDKNPFYGKHHTEKSKKQAMETRSQNPNWIINLIESFKTRDTSGPKNGMFGKNAAKPKRSKLIYKQVMFRSSWEMKYAQYLDSLDISWEYEPQTLLLNDGCGYTPDFLVNGKFIEIKGGYWNDDSKYQLAKTYYPEFTFEILDGKKLKEMRII